MCFLLMLALLSLLKQGGRSGRAVLCVPRALPAAEGDAPLRRRCRVRSTGWEHRQLDTAGSCSGTEWNPAGPSSACVPVRRRRGPEHACGPLDPGTSQAGAGKVQQ